MKKLWNPLTIALLSFVSLNFVCGCGSNCGVPEDGTCPKGCVDVKSRPTVEGSNGPCLGEFEILACQEKGDESLVDSCAVSPEGTVYGLGKSQATLLISEHGFRSCTIEERGSVSTLQRCE